VELQQPNLTTIGKDVLAKRYLVRNEAGDVVETPQERFMNVAKHVAQAERNYGVEPDSIWPRFYKLMASRDFMPNTPCLVNAGREDNPGQLSACFVLPVEDSMDAIFTSLHDMAMIHKTGGGTGFSFSRLRPAGDFVKSTTGIASGPVSFMKTFNHVTECVKQSGVRRGANMGILRVDHPDIMPFIDCKRTLGELENFNISVGITDAFMDALETDSEYELVNPRNGKVTGKLRARNVMARIVENAWLNGDPGLFFIDRVNELDPLTCALGEIEACNPCGEVPLRPYDACDLGSINLGNFYREGAAGPVIDFERLESVIRDAVRFLDNVHDVNQYPVPQINERTKASRKIGLGVMGWADLLIRMGIPYGSQQGLDMAEELQRFITTKAIAASEELAALRGPFPLFEKSKHFINGRKHRRNSTCTVIAPTGSISIIAGCSGGIEPIFAIVQTRKQAEMEMVDVNPMFIDIAKREGFYSEALLERVKENGTVKDDPDVPTRWQRVFAIANEIDPEYHIRMQAAFQRHVEDAVSKTINLPNDATIEDVARAYQLAWSEGCKGITVYRDESREGQTLTIGAKTTAAPELHPVPTGSYELVGQMIQTPTGKLSVKLGLDAKERPFEAWLAVSRAGTAVSADCEAIARLGSLVLRMDSPIKPERRLQLIADQLAGIGGGDSVGFGQDRVLSLPDGVAKAVRSLADALEARRAAGQAKAEQAVTEPSVTTVKVPSSGNGHNGNGHSNGNGHNGNGHGNGNGHKHHKFGDICPDCHQVALYYGEGCAKCALCGYSRC